MAKKERIPSESAEQIAFVARVRAFYPSIVIFAIPNGGGRSAQEATRLKEEGVLAGVADTFISFPNGEYHGLYIEMKRVKGGRQSVEQKQFENEVKAVGYQYAVCKGREAAWEVFKEYIGV